MEELTVDATPHLVNDRGLEIDKDGARNMLSGPGFCK
jgi:hypothetical protein